MASNVGFSKTFIARNTGSYQKISSAPMKRNALDIHCPCKERAEIPENGCNWWTCESCDEIIDQGFDDSFYCTCGKASCKLFEFKCNDPNHGNDFRKYNLDVLSMLLSKQNPKPELNILILGPTGVGKSTWINSFVNYVTFSTLKDAKQADRPLSLIGGSFHITDSNYISKKIVINNNDSNESDNTVGQSSTQHAKAFVFEQKDRLLRLIDTPGVGDTRGVEQDSLNFENILKFLTQLNELHAICILLKPNEPRLTLAFKYCIQDLLKHLHKDALQNIMFCFTNTRGTFFRPGESLSTLKQLLREQFINLTLDERNIFCMDNEAFKLLCALKQKVRFTEAEVKQFEGSWDTSVAETNRLIDTISNLKPHNLQGTQSLNKTRQSFLILIKPIGDITQNIQSNIAVVEDKKLELSSRKQTTMTLKKDLYIPRINLIPVPLERPRTVCTASKCVQYHKIPSTKETRIDYITHCHRECYLKNVIVEQYPAPQLKNCAAMGGTLNCKSCGCPWDTHMHITYENKKELCKEVDQETQLLIYSNASTEKLVETTIRNLNTRLEDLEREKNIILHTSAKLASFLKNFAIVAYNDAMTEYLEKLIEMEKQKVAFGGDKQILAGLEDMLKKYQVERLVLEDLSLYEESNDAIDLDEIDNSINSLFSLPLMGSVLKHSFDVAADARKQIMAYCEKRYRFKSSEFKEKINFFKNKIAGNAPR